MRSRARTIVQRQMRLRASRPQLKRDPLGGSGAFMARIDFKEATRPALLLALGFTLVNELLLPHTDSLGTWLYFAVLKFCAFFGIGYVIGTLYGTIRSFVVPRTPPSPDSEPPNKRLKLPGAHK